MTGRDRDTLGLLLFWAATVLAITVATWLALGAPAPVKKIGPVRPVTRAECVGRWRLDYFGTAFDCDLYGDGQYGALWMGDAWHGTWTFDGVAVKVAEYPAENGPPASVKYKFRPVRAKGKIVRSARCED